MTTRGPHQRAIESPSPRPVAFLDRDGVLNVDSGFPYRPEHLVWIEGAAAAVQRLNAAGYLVVVVTNQSGVARGLYTELDVHSFHGLMNRQLQDAGARIDAFRHCPHHPEGTVARYRLECHCRKPAPGMIVAALATLAARRTGSFLIGDRETDIMAARAAGIPGFRFEGGNLCEFVETVLDRTECSA